MVGRQSSSGQTSRPTRTERFFIVILSTTVHAHVCPSTTLATVSMHQLAVGRRTKMSTGTVVTRRTPRTKRHSK